MRAFALTGGPGVGKTTLADEFARRGFAVARESGRAVVRDHPEFATADRSPDERHRFAELVTERDRRTWAWALDQAGPVIFDRTAVDNLGEDADGRTMVLARSVRLAGPVALLPIWPAIFRRDGERRWSLEQARATEAAVRSAYERLKHPVMDVPCWSAAERVDWLVRLWGL